MTSRLPLAGEPIGGSSDAFASRWAVTRKGFRLFFLVGAAYAAVAVPLWLAMLLGHIAPVASWAGPWWHAHEMLFGFTAAIIAGFLLTAVANWTGRDTATGSSLLGLGGLWFAGRVAMTSASWLPPLVVAAVDLAFLPALAFALARPLRLSKSRRNYPFLVLLALLFAANLLMHLQPLGVLAVGAARGATFGVYVVALMIAIIGGRVIPMFTRNVTRDDRIRSRPALDIAAAFSLIAVMFAESLGAQSEVVAALALLAAGLLAVRAVHWGTLRALDPMLWVLHAGYFWLPVALLLRALSALWIGIPASSAMHALTAGAIGTMTLGMMARVTLGHTGRLISAAPATRAAFILVTAAAVVRVALPAVDPTRTLAAWIGAGVLWTAAFAAFLYVYAPMLVRPRVDGRPG